MQEQENKPSIIKPKTADLVVPEVFNIANTEINKTLLKAAIDLDIKHVIKSIDDKEGYAESLKLRAKYRSLRTGLESWRKSKVKPINSFLKRLKSETDSLGLQAEKAEQFFEQQMHDIDAEKVRIAEEKRLAKQRVLSYRIAAISAIGATFDGERYSYPYTTGNVITGAELNDFTDDDFQQYLAFSMGDWDEEQLRLENKRIADEQAETERLATIEANNKLALELAKKTKETREREVTRVLGGVLENGVYVLPGFGKQVIPVTTLETATNDEWDALIKDIEAWVEPVVIPEISGNIQLKVITEEAYDIVNKSHSFIVNKQVEPVESITVSEMGSFEKAEEIDYSLNDFENLTRGCYNGTEKEKQIILEAIASYKQGMANF